MGVSLLLHMRPGNAPGEQCPSWPQWYTFSPPLYLGLEVDNFLS